MGFTFFDEHADIQTTLKYWRHAIKIRNDNTIDGNPLPKLPVNPTRDSFGNITEFTTLEELNSIALDLDAIRIQSLLICERILGEHHKDTLNRLMYRGASYADALRYQNCINFLKRTLEIRILFTDTCFTAQDLVRIMVDLNELTDRSRDKEKPKFTDVVDVFKLLTSQQLTESRQLLEKLHG